MKKPEDSDNSDGAWHKEVLTGFYFAILLLGYFVGAICLFPALLLGVGYVWVQNENEEEVPDGCLCR